VNILSPGQTCSDEYDYGTATELMLEMISEREVEAKGRTIQVLARNNSLMISCERVRRIMSVVKKCCCQWSTHRESACAAIPDKTLLIP